MSDNIQYYFNTVTIRIFRFKGFHTLKIKTINIIDVCYTSVYTATVYPSKIEFIKFKYPTFFRPSMQLFVLNFSKYKLEKNSIVFQHKFMFVNHSTWISKYRVTVQRLKVFLMMYECKCVIIELNIHLINRIATNAIVATERIKIRLERK